MRKFVTFCCVLAAIALLACLFVLSVQLVVNDRGFFALEYQKMDTARRLGVKQSELEEVTNDLLDYLNGEDVDLSNSRIRIDGEKRRAFSSDEATHMKDVQDLYSGAKTVRNISLLFVALVLLCTLLGVKRERSRLYAKAYVMGFCIIGAVFLVLGIWIQLDFDTFWNAFHLLFFRNMLWQMDPSSSFMINMFPGQFWYDVCMKVVMYFAIGAGTLLLASVIVLIVQKQRRNTVMLLEEEGFPGEAYERGEAADDRPNTPTGPWAPWQDS